MKFNLLKKNLVAQNLRTLKNAIIKRRRTVNGVFMEA